MKRTTQTEEKNMHTTKKKTWIVGLALSALYTTLALAEAPHPKVLVDVKSRVEKTVTEGKVPVVTTPSLGPLRRSAR